jgi:flagellar hook capping protein FlgD
VGNFGGFGWYFGDVAVDPANAEQVYSLGVDLVRSTNGGQTFSNVAGSTHPDHHAIWIDPSNSSRVYDGNDGGFFSSSNGAAAWTKSVDLPISQFYAGAVDPSNPLRLTGGMQDNGMALTTGSVPNWASIFIADGFQCIIDPVNPNTLFSEYEYASEGSGPVRSTDNGVTFHSPHGFDPSDRYNWNTPIVMDPSNHNVLLSGSQRVYRSTDNGLNYGAISGDLSTNPAASLVFGTISALAISPASSAVYYAGTDDGRAWRSLDAGSTWTEISAGLPVRYITRLAADPADVGTVYVTLSGFGQDEHVARVYRSLDYGTTWSSISGDLPDVPVNDLVVDPTSRSRLYAGTDAGVWFTQDVGSHWAMLAAGLPVLPVTDLTLHSASRTLVAATYGRSQWKIDVSQLPAAVPATTSRPMLALSAPRPNPSRGIVHFALARPFPGRVDVGIYDVVGRRLRSLANGSTQSGTVEFQWNGEDDRGRRVGPGIFFVRAASGDECRVQRITRLR